MALPVALSLVLSFAVLFAVARWSLPGALTAGALALGLLTLPPATVVWVAGATLGDPSVLALALAVAVIPLIGGVMEEGGLMDRLVASLRMGRRPFLAIAPAMVGMLPMPGGALLSAPLVERRGADVPGELKAAINVWYRHLMLLIYPLSPSLIASAQMAGLGVYEVIPWQVPGFLFCGLLGYVLLLRKVPADGPGEGDPRTGIVPMAVLFSAPAVDLLLQRAGLLPFPTLGALAGVTVGLVLAYTLTGPKGRDLGSIVRRMRPWGFGAIVLGMFLFLEMFTTSPAPSFIAEVAPSQWALLVPVGFLLGAATGRIQLPASILIPIHLAMVGASTMRPIPFAVMYLAVFLGYMISPVHPCLVVSLEYFRTDLRRFARAVAGPVTLAFLAAGLVGLMVL